MQSGLGLHRTARPRARHGQPRVLRSNDHVTFPPGVSGHAHLPCKSTVAGKGLQQVTSSPLRERRSRRKELTKVRWSGLNHTVLHPPAPSPAAEQRGPGQSGAGTDRPRNTWLPRSLPLALPGQQQTSGHVQLQP